MISKAKPFDKVGFTNFENESEPHSCESLVKYLGDDIDKKQFNLDYKLFKQVERMSDTAERMRGIQKLCQMSNLIETETIWGPRMTKKDPLRKDFDALHQLLVAKSSQKDSTTTKAKGSKTKATS